MNLSKLKNYNKFSSKGFTLIELLIVIAILGVLAAGILVAIDPVEQLGKGRDSGRKSSIGQIGRALQAFYTSHADSANNPYPCPTGAATPCPNPVGDDWSEALVNSGEIKIFPDHPVTSPATTCTAPGIRVNGICYKTNAAGTEVIVYTHLESKSETEKYPPTCTSVATTWYLYSTSDGRAGTWCGVEPVAPGTGNPMASATFH